MHRRFAGGIFLLSFAIVFVAAIDYSIIDERFLSENTTAIDSPTVVVNTNATTNASLETHGVPGNPTDVVAVAYDGRAQISWKPPDDDGSDRITHYEVATFVQDDNEPIRGSVVIGSSDAKTPPETYIMVGKLTNGVSYSFKVRAENKNGFSTWSARSAPVSPLHPPDLCTHVTCSGHGMCFPNYDASKEGNSDHAVVNHNAMCICHAGYQGSDCSIVNEDEKYMYDVSDWGECSNGCGGGQRTRTVMCINTETQTPAIDEMSCGTKRQTRSQICNNMACGSNLVDVNYEIDINYDEVIFTSQSKDQFVEAFATELAAALDTSTSRFSITSLHKGSIWVHFLILPPAKEGEKSLDELIESLQKQLQDPNSKLRTKGTFARHVNPDSLKLSFFIAERANAGQSEDISVVGLIGTVLVLVTFISLFAWYLRRRHERIMMVKGHRTEAVIGASRSELKPMGIRTMK